MDGTASAPAGPPARKRGLARGLLQAAQSRWAKVRGALQSVQRAARLAALDKNQFKVRPRIYTQHAAAARYQQCSTCLSAPHGLCLQAEAQAAIQDAQAGSSGVKLTVTSQDLSKINYLQQVGESMHCVGARGQLEAGDDSVAS